MAITNNLSHLAIGLGGGTVLLYRHLLQSLTTSPTSLTSLPKARVVFESSEPITGLGFRESTNSPSQGGKAGTTSLSLFIVTLNKVLCAPVSGKGGEARTIDDLGCGLDCATMDWSRSNLIMAKDEAIYHITWLKEPKGLHKLRHSPIEVTFLIQIVTISLVNISNSRFTDTLRMGEAQGRGVQVTSIEDFQLGRCRVFVQS